MRLGRPGLFAWLAFLAALLTLGLILPTYWVYLFSTVAVSAIVARSIGLVTNQAGIITLCQMSFAAIGGWVVSWIALAWPGVPFPLLVLIGGAAAAPIGWLLGAVTTRIRGVELAVVTLGFAAALDLVLRQGTFPGVGEGTPMRPSAPFDDPRWFFALAWALLIVLQFAVVALGRSRHGLGWAAVRANERAAAALGVRVGLAKASALGVGAGLAGASGGLLAGQYGLLTPQVFTPLTSMLVLATAVLAGASLFSGAVLAGALTVFMPELLRRIGLPLDVGNALLALGAFDVLRRGNGGLAEQFAARLQGRAFRDARVTCELGPLPPRANSGGHSTQNLPTTLPASQASAAPPTQVLGQSLPAEPCFEVTALTVEYGPNRVLDAVDLTVAQAEVHALIGPNGAGKTTLVDAVSGFLPSYGGVVRLRGDPLDGLTARERARTGMRRTFQHLRSIDALTVDEYLRLAAGPADLATSSRVHEFLGLPDGRVPIRLIDSGSRRLLEIAGALAAGPKIVLLDEPAAGLGEDERLGLAERVRRIPAEFGCAVLLIEHDMEFVRAASDRATVLDDGGVIASGGVAQVLADPRVAAAYLGQEVER
ncbi:branched-chain amino acid ABC transporter ATP-binding protein/permease [Leucobacter sp. Z1108]|uniref:branched-chain amino acid ABC transporter ATP-binding protein/permease n=1 Tax=Leucobacter sp. Z1108 TaxID=3439066 RepID=UPI003F2EA6ED